MASPTISSLVERSIQVWGSLQYANLTIDNTIAIARHSEQLRKVITLEDLLEHREYWFFQLRESFLRQTYLLKWGAEHLDEYVLLPIDYGFVNNKDCLFISHYWRTRDHPDPEGEDLQLFIQDLKDDTSWSYIWTDWTCIPQYNDGSRSRLEEYYFMRMLLCIPMLVRDCAIEWRFPAHEPRAWVLYEVAEYVPTHSEHVITDDNRCFVEHIREMLVEGVRPTLAKYKYKCTSESDMMLVTDWLEILVIMTKVFPDDIASRQDVLDVINRPYAGSYSNPILDITVDKAKGEVRHKDIVYGFTPVFEVTAYVSSPPYAAEVTREAERVAS